MKKFSKLFALTLAAALTLGMTVNAAESGSTTNNNGQTITTETLADAATDMNQAAKADEDGEILSAAPVSVAVYDSADDKAADIVKAETDGETTSYTIVVVDLTLIDTDDNSVVSPNSDKWYEIPGVTVASGKDAKVLHSGNNGASWETLESKVESGKVFAKFNSLSPVAVITFDAKEEDDDDPEDNSDDTTVTTTTSVAATTGVAASPKTGETASVAVLFAVASLGAAVACSRKARYNK